MAARRSHSVAVSNGSGESEHHQSSEGHDPAKPDRVMWGKHGKYNINMVLCLGHSSFLNGDESDMFSYNFRSLGLLKSIMASFA